MKSLVSLFWNYRRVTGSRISYRKWLAMGIAGLCVGAGSNSEAAIGVNLSSGTLAITGTSSADVISVEQYNSGGGVYKVKIGATQYNIECLDVERISLTGGSGNDDIDFDSYDSSKWTNVVDGEITIRGGYGNGNRSRFC